MPKLPRLEHVERDNRNDVEVGCLVWSTTISTGSFPLGGIVLEVDFDGELTVMLTVLAWDGRTPTLRHLPLNDIDPATMTFFTRGALIDAKRLNDYLNRLTLQQLRTPEAQQWGKHQSMLLRLGAVGSLLPEAEARYQEGREATKRERGW